MLDAPQRDRLLRLFAEGSELPAAQRAAFVGHACGDDPAVQRELAELLRIEDDTLADFLAEPAVAIPDDLSKAMAASSGGGTHPAAAPAPTAAPPQIEGYAQLQQIAEGGMGAVYRAQQLHPVRRTVALKVIRQGLDSDAVLARFEAERQALALMSHPYIAAVYDAGTDAMGRPFIAMEFVDGLPVTDYCAAEQLPLSERLRLFVKVCQAVDHAHRRGVLHRDLKPSNVLVWRSGGEVMPKVIDFGIAKAMEGSLGELSIHTLQGSFLGTPEYMSPEQIDGTAAAVDTRSDVYSLGVMLYELVTGVRPIESARLHEVGLMRYGKIIGEQIPVKPSTRLRTLLRTERGRALEFVDSAQWVRRLQGDLDWVVMKALEKEPDRRYGSPRELSADIENFLAHLPVAAGPPSGLYRLRKFTRRYRAQVVAAALVLLSLVVGLFGTVWFLLESRANEAAAIARAAEAEGVRLAAEAAMLDEENPNQALLLALRASELTEDHAVKQTIHRILPHHAALQILDGHDLGVKQLRFLADGRLLSRGGDSVVLLWDSDAGALLRRFPAHQDFVTRMAVDAAERRLLTVSWDRTARLWDIDSGECLLVVDDHRARLTWGAFSADGTRFATSSDDGTARVFDTRTGQPELLLEHRLGVSCVAFDPGGLHIATRSYDRVTRIWDGATGVLVRTLEAARPLPVGPPLPTASGSELVWYSPRGTRLVSVADLRGASSTLLVHTSAGRRLLELPGARRPRFLDDERMAFSIVGGGWGLVRLLSGEVERHPGIVSAVPTPDGRRAIAVDSRFDTCLVDLVSGSVVRRYLGPTDKASPPDVAFHPDGKRFAVAGAAIRIWSFAPEFAPTDLPGRAVSYGAALAMGPTTLALLRREADDRSIWTVVGVADQRELCSIERPGLEWLNLAPCGTRLVGSVQGDGAADRRVEVFDLEGRIRREIPLPRLTTQAPETSSVLTHAVSDDGRLLVSAVRPTAAHLGPAPDSVMQCHDLETGALLASIPDPGGWIAQLAGSGPERMVACWARERRTAVLDWRTGAVVACVEGPGHGWHLAADITRDGRYLLVVMGDQRAAVWDLTRLQRPDDAPIAVYPNLVRSDNYRGGFVAGGRLAWAMCSNEVHIFSPLTGRAYSVLRLAGNCATVTQSPDGTELITLTEQGRCQRWPLDPLPVARRLAVGRLSARELARFQVGTPATRLAEERAFLAAHPKPRHFARLGDLALAEDDLDEAIACYQRSVELGPLRPEHVGLDIYLKLLELRCRRLGVARRSTAQRSVDQRGALEVLEQVIRCGASDEQVLAVPGIAALRGLGGLGRFGELLRK